MLYSIVGILVIIIDQLVKFWVEDTLFGTDIVRFIPGVVSLVNVHNYGAAFGFLDTAGARIYFLIAAGAFALLVVIALATNFISGRLSRWCLVLVAAGGLGNMIDRLLYGYVIDMFKVELFNFPVFNVADIFITVFAILFVLAMFFEKPDDDIETLYEDIEEAEEKPKKARRKKAKGEEALPEAAAAEQQALPAAEQKTLPTAKPAKQKKVSAARKARQDKYEKEYEEYKAQQQEAMRRASAARSAAQAPRAEEDPFAAWEQANAKADAARADGYAGRVMQTPAPQTVGTAPKRASKPAAPAAETKPAAPKAAAAPAPASKPAPQPAPKSAPAEDEFNLDDILAEFR